MAELDLIVRGGELVDGTGARARRADVGIVGDRVRRVGDLASTTAARTIDARGKVVCPGFVDVQSQSVFTVLADGRAESHVRQGITTELVGEGGAPGQLTRKVMEQDSRFAAWLSALGLELDWDGYRGWCTRLERQGISVNVGSFASVDLLRAEAVGLEDRPPTDAELEQMKAILARAMDDGCFGLATALVYPPASFTSTDELVALAEVAAQKGGMYASHVRGESGRVFDAVAEAIAIGRRARLPVLVYHLKIAGRGNWGRMDALCSHLEDAGVAACQYPYAAAGTGICAPLPDWTHEGGTQALLARLRDPDVRARIRHEMESRDALLGRVDYEAIELDGKRLGDFDAYVDAVLASEGAAFAIFHSMSEDDVRTAMRRPWVSVASDAEATSPALGGQVHPRAYGTFPRVLGRYVREEKVLTLEEAIRKMTSLPASQVGLDDRGVLREGALADVVVFDPDRVIDTATFGKAHSFPIGIETVIVNGVVTVDEEAHTGARAGRPVQRRTRASQTPR
jgi:N-acyl-D-aspartate/D-glutamate deacylase